MLRFNGGRPANDYDLTIFQYILCYGSTNMHRAICLNKKKFQYILCYGSTVQQGLQQAPPTHFNTSYVTVQRKSWKSGSQKEGDFNTSYVTVQHF